MFSKKYMKLLIFLIFLSCNNMNIDSKDPVFDVAVSFNSMGTGTPGDAYLQELYTSHKKKHKLQAYKAAGCGREGEFFILFSTNGMSPEDRNTFVKEVELQVDANNKANKARDENSGSMEVIHTITKETVAHCRIPLSKWDF
jgi:hypothetical protein